MINPTDDEVSFIRRLHARHGELSLQGSVKLLNIGRLIPEYVTHHSASMDTGVFTLTPKGLAQMNQAEALARLRAVTGPCASGAILCFKRSKKENASWDEIS